MRSIATLALVLLAGSAAGGPPTFAGLIVPRLDADGQPLPPGVAFRLGSTRFQSGSVGHAVAFSPDGRTLITAGGGGGVRAWDTATGRSHWAWPGPPGSAGLGPVVATPDGRSAWVAQLSDPYGRDTDAILVKLDLATGRVLDRLPIGPEYSGAVALAADGRRAAWYDPKAGAVRVADLVTGTAVREFRTAAGEPAYSLALNRDGSVLVVRDVNNQVRVYQLTGVGPRAVMRGVVRAGVSPDGRRVVGLVPRADGPGRGIAAHVWDAATGKEVCVTPAGKEGVFYEWMAVAFSPDGATFAVSGFGRDVTLYDTATAKPVRRFPGLGGCRALTFSPDGTVLAGGPAGTILWDVATGAKLHQSADMAGCGFAGELHFAPDGSRLAVAGAADDDMVTWHLITGREVARLGPAAVAAQGYGPRVAPLYTGRPIPVRSPDGRRLARPVLIESAGKGSPTRWGVAVTDAGTRAELCRIADDELVTECQFSADGAYLLTGGCFGARRVTVWDAGTGHLRHRLAPVADPGNNIMVHRSTFAAGPDGRHVAAIDRNQIIDSRRQYEFTCAVYDAVAGREVARLTGPGLLSRLAWAADGTTLVGVGTNNLWRPDAGILFVADRRTGRFIRPPFPTGSGPAAVAVSADGKEVATGAADGVRLWEAATGALRHTFPAGSFLHGSLAYGPDGRWLAAAGGGQAVLVWDLHQHRTAGPPAAGSAAVARAWDALASPDGAAAYRAARALAAAPELAVPFLAGMVPPAAPPDPARLAKLVADLDAPAFADREAAQKELIRLGELAEPVVRRAARESASDEVRTRAAAVLQALAKPDQGRLRVGRAVEAVGWMGTPEARALLARWAGGAEGAWLTRDARTTLGPAKGDR